MFDRPVHFLVALFPGVAMDSKEFKVQYSLQKLAIHARQNSRRTFKSLCSALERLQYVCFCLSIRMNTNNLIGRELAQIGNDSPHFSKSAVMIRIFDFRSE